MSTDAQVGGLRDVWKSSASVPADRETSARISEVLKRCLGEAPSLDRMPPRF